MALTAYARSLGNSGIKVSPLGLGTVKFGRNQGVKYPQSFQLPDDQQCLQLLQLAAESGINLLDTAPAYGHSETRLGRLLRGWRDDWVIVSKVGEEFVDGRSYFDFSATATRLSVERSLRRLDTDRLDAVLIHSSGNDLEILQQEDCLDTLIRLKDKGLIRSIGMSGKTVAGGLMALEHCDLVMVTYNLLYKEELPVIRAAETAGKGVLIKKGFMSGHLAEFTRNINQSDSADEALQPAVDADIAVTASLRLLFAEPGISSVIIGTLNPDHLRANVAIARRLLATAHPG